MKRGSQRHYERCSSERPPATLSTGRESKIHFVERPGEPEARRVVSGAVLMSGIFGDSVEEERQGESVTHLCAYIFGQFIVCREILPKSHVPLD